MACLVQTLGTAIAMQVELPRGDLLEIARDLRPATGDLKLNVVDLATSLGITVNLRAGHRYSDRQGKLSFGSQPTITLYRRAEHTASLILATEDNRLLTNSERFSVAHEIGHWILWDRFHIRPAENKPNQKTVYWSQECLVNAFAGSLLVPEWYIQHRLREIRVGKAIAPNIVSKAAAEIGVSRDVMAKEICRFRPEIGFMRLALIKRRQDGRLALKVDEVCVGEGLELPNRHKHILNERFRDTIMATKSGVELLRGCSLHKRRVENLWVSWHEVKPAIRLISQRGELCPDRGVLGRWVSIARSERGERGHSTLL